VTEISDPPASASPGGQFTVIDTVTNQGATDAADSTVRYYLVGNSGKKDLPGSRAVGPLAPAGFSEGQTVVTISASTAPGSYSVQACADDLKVIAESNEKNNCKQSATKIDVVAP
jgi:subtilase family serine protease